MNEPDCHEYRIVEVDLLVALLLPDDPLLAHEADGEKHVDGEVDHLGVDQGHGQVAVAGHVSQPSPEAVLSRIIRTIRIILNYSLFKFK